MLVLEGEYPVANLAFTPDNTRIVVGGRDPRYPFAVRSSEVWTLATGERLRVPVPKGASDLAVAVHPSSRFAFFAYGCSLCAVSLADGTVQELSRTRSSAGGAAGVIVSPDGKWVVCANRTTEDTPDFYGFRCDVNKEPAFSRGWEVGARVPREHLAGFLGTGDRFVTVGTRRIVVRETETGAVRSEVRFHAEFPLASVLSPDGSRLAVRSSSQFYLWNAVTWEKRLQVTTENRPYIAYAFHPTRPILAVIQYLQTLVKFLDADTGKVVRKFQWKLGGMRSVAFSPDGTLAAAGSADGKVVVWDVD